MSAFLALLLISGLARAEDDEDDTDEVIVVTGSRTEQALSETVVVTEVITREEIADSGAEDVAELLETESGVEIQRSFQGAGVSMQGFGPKYVLILVDGKRMTGRTGGVIDLSRIPAERIERIEIVKGAASALYGSDAVGGVINIITREPEGPFTSRTHASYGSRNTLDASLDAGANRGDLRGSGRLGWHMTDGYDWEPDTPRTNGPEYWQASGDVDGAWRPTSELELDAAASYLLRDSKVIYGEAWEGEAIFDDRNLTEEATGSAGMRLLVGEAAKLTASALVSTYRNQYQRDQRGSSALDTYEDTHELIGQAEAQLDVLWGRQLISVGVEGLGERLKTPRLAGLEGDDSDVRQRARGALFLQDEIRLGRDKQLAIVPSGRVDLDSMFGAYASPRLALRLDPVESLALRMAGGMGYRAPSFREMYVRYENPTAGYVFEGNPDLGPETSFNLSAGVEYTPAKGLSLRVDAFRNRLHDMIDYGQLDPENAPQDWTYLNIAEAETRGGEIAIRYRLSKALVLNAGYTYTWTWDHATERHLDHRAPHRATLGLIGRYQPWELDGTVRAQFVGPTRYYFDAEGQDEEVLADPYLHLKLRVEKSILPRRLRAFAGVDNLLNEGDAEYIHLDPRTFYVGLTFDAPVPEDEP